MSAAEIAEAVGTSDATVVRTAKSLGYDGMRQLRRALSDREAEPDLTSRLEATISDFRTDKDIVAATVERHLRALDTLLSQVTPELFDSAVNMLTSARRTWWCGTGPSAYIAGYASFLTRRLGRASGVLTHSGTDHADELLALGRGDVVVVLAYGRVHSYVRVLLRHAREVGATTILITDTLGSSLAAETDLRVDAGRGTPGVFASHATTMVLVETLVLAVAATKPKLAKDALDTLNDLRSQIAGRHLPVDPP
jgi:DNA-binding MurR/RpiR family transcriptional regulator